MVFNSALFNTASSAATVSEDAGIEPRTVAMAVRRSNQSNKPHPISNIQHAFLCCYHCLFNFLSSYLLFLIDFILLPFSL